MNIDKFSDITASQAAQKAVAVRAIRQQQAVAESDFTASASDQVDMSMIGHLMARSVRMLADSEGVRPEVIAKHQMLAKQNARFDDHTIDRIFARMQAP